MEHTNDFINSFRLEAAFYDGYTEHPLESDAESDEENGYKERWYKVRELGNGGGSEAVWLEKETRGKVRAVKQLRRGLRASSISGSRELLAMAKLKRHRRYFVKLFGWFEYQQSICIAMEFFPLGDLQSHLDEEGPTRTITENDTQTITTQILKGLQIMHQNGFAHRDLKPKNIFVAMRSPEWRIKIGDFGISKRVLADATALRTTVYTPGYAAPEMLDDGDQETSEYSNAVDIWCVGVITYLMLATRLPFPTERGLMEYAQGRKLFPTDELHARNATPDAIDFVRALLAVNPLQRPSVELALGLSWIKTKGNVINLRIPSSQSDRRDLPLRNVATAGLVSSGADLENQSSTVTRDGQVTNMGNAIRAASSEFATVRKDLTGLAEMSNPLHDAERWSKPRSLDNTLTIPTQSPAKATISISQRPQIFYVVGLGQVQVEKPVSKTDYSLPIKNLTSLEMQIILKTSAQLIFQKDYYEYLFEDRPCSGSIRKPALWWIAASNDLAIAPDIIQHWDVDVNSRDDAHGESGLAKSITDGNENMVRLLLKLPDIDVNIRDFEWGLTPLMLAAAKGHANITQTLLNQKLLRLNEKDRRWGRTALSWAAGEGQYETTRILLNHPAIDVEAGDLEGRTALWWASRNGNLNVVSLLASKSEVDISIRDCRGQTPIWEAAAEGHVGVVEYLIPRIHGLSAVTDDQGRTPLIIAANRGHDSVVRSLLSPSLRSGLGHNAVQSNLQWRDRMGRNALISASRSGQDRVIQVILSAVPAQERKAVVDLSDGDGRTALSWAAGEGHAFAVRRLLQMGSRATSSLDNQERSPLSRAAERGHEEIVNILLRADPLTADLADAQGRTPLSWAAGQGNLPIVNILLQFNVDINSSDINNWSILRWAAEGGFHAVTAALLKVDSMRLHDYSGHTFLTRLAAEGPGEESAYIWSRLVIPDQVIDLPDQREGRTPLSWAVSTGHKYLVRRLLLSSSVNPSSIDTSNLTPMSWAITNGNQLMATILNRHPRLQGWDRQIFWEQAPKWAIRDRILHYIQPTLRPRLTGFKVSDSIQLRDEPRFDIDTRSNYNGLSLLTECLFK